LDDQLNLGLGYSTTGILATRLFSGAVYDSYQLKVYVQIYDNDKAFAFYEIPQQIIVLPDYENLQTIIDQLISKNPLFSTNKILNEGSFLLSIQDIQRITSLLNERSLSDKLGLILHGNAPIFPQTFGPLSNYSGVFPVKIKFDLSVNFSTFISISKSNVILSNIQFSF
jgi:hypothetical protein